MHFLLDFDVVGSFEVLYERDLLAILFESGLRSLIPVKRLYFVRPIVPILRQNRTANKLLLLIPLHPLHSLKQTLIPEHPGTDIHQQMRPPIHNLYRRGEPPPHLQRTTLHPILIDFLRVVELGVPTDLDHVDFPEVFLQLGVEDLEDLLGVLCAGVEVAQGELAGFLEVEDVAEGGVVLVVGDVAFEGEDVGGWAETPQHGAAGDVGADFLQEVTMGGGQGCTDGASAVLG